MFWYIKQQLEGEKKITFWSFRKIKPQLKSLRHRKKTHNDTSFTPAVCF